MYELVESGAVGQEASLQLVEDGEAVCKGKQVEDEHASESGKAVNSCDEVRKGVIVRVFAFMTALLVLILVAVPCILLPVLVYHRYGTGPLFAFTFAPGVAVMLSIIALGCLAKFSFGDA
mmetsp:Transcript_8857/g.36668  ORF Transcript_8857/g.36668 Transcript_8857/m.36668 type:complete len:120 (-) Transcript_8857:20-379(-)